MAHELPALPYPKEALEPHIDAQTMEIHHGKHHAAYVTNLNKALAGKGDLENKPIEELIRNLEAVPAEIRAAVRNNGGGHANHTLYWQIMSKSGVKEPIGELAKAIDARFGSFSSFQDQLARAATGVFGSGWAWLTVDAGKQLALLSTPNQDTPLSTGHSPLFGIDVWEHAYYLKYQNRRNEYIAGWWNVVNWDEIARRFSLK